jgi:hypothetical protein
MQAPHGWSSASTSRRNPVSTAVRPGSDSQSMRPERRPLPGAAAAMPAGWSGSPTGSSMSGVTPRLASSGLHTCSHVARSGAFQVFATSAESHSGRSRHGSCHLLTDGSLTRTERKQLGAGSGPLTRRGGYNRRDGREELPNDRRRPPHGQLHRKDPPVVADRQEALVRLILAASSPQPAEDHRPRRALAPHGRCVLAGCPLVPAGCPRGREAL